MRVETLMRLLIFLFLFAAAAFVFGALPTVADLAVEYIADQRAGHAIRR